VARIGEVKRVTKETNVSVKINLDGSAVAENNTGIPFLDHMLDVSYFTFFFFISLFLIFLGV
jgi:imidazoleglycerol phosphate dehydratase HisB